ncbi:uncharacterized protein ofcc1 [Synchiropus splendidus]|uniref:uncharacterized protein ofcc1 n=1 Tax=Synchiropus splendidus TaxID=270530 RepID=UPI00237DF320|nr:uncharacterized protein ofcc1 [Synchiropus splendidus]
MHTFINKLQQKAVQQPKQKKSKSAEFLMGGEEESAAATDGRGSAEPRSPIGLQRGIQGDTPDRTHAAHPKNMELQAAAKGRGNEGAQNYFDLQSEEQTDPRHRRMAGVNTEDELELKILNADENTLYGRMAAMLEEEDAFIDLPGTLVASRDEKVLEVKAGNPVFQRQLLLHGGFGAPGFGLSQGHATAKAQAVASAEHDTQHGPHEGRTVMSRDTTVKMKAAQEVIPDYAQRLRESVQPDMITLGSLSLQQQTAQKRHPQRSAWVQRKKKLMSLLTRNVTEPHSQGGSHETVSSASPRGPNTHHHWTGRSQSLRAVGEGQEALTNSGQGSEPHESLASQVGWLGSASQPVEVCVYCLRALKDKLPRGLYAVSVALHSCLGGPAMTWNQQQDGQVTTRPVEHKGHFYDIDLHVNQSFVLILPGARELVPSMVLVFQLIELPGQNSHTRSVQAWGAFPACDLSFRVAQGRFKVPLLRGEPDSQLDQFKKIESLISSDLDHWLCNMYFQVKRLPPRTSGVSESSVTLLIPPSVTLQPEVHQSQTPSQLKPLSGSQLHPRPIHSQLDPQHHAGPSCRGAELGVHHYHQGSPLHLSADSACSSSSLPGSNWSFSSHAEEKGDPCREKAEGGTPFKKKPIKKTNSRGPSTSGSSAHTSKPAKHKRQNLLAEEMEDFTFSLQSSQSGPSPSRLYDRAHLALRMLPLEMGLPLPRQQQLYGGWRSSAQQLGLIMLLLALMWFVRLYLHYGSQWLYLQAIAVPVNKFQLHAHTVDLVYQSSLLHTREELAMVVVGPLTLNAVMFLLVLIRWACQQIFGSLPSFTSKFIMAQGVWTVLNPLAVFAVDAILGHLHYNPERPVADAAKLFWHFYRVDRSGRAGIIITLFLYTVIFLLSITIFFIYMLRFHNDGRMLDVFQRITAREGKYFLPQDLELSNRELSYIVKKAEQWRGYNGERRKVAVNDYIWTSDDPVVVSATPHDDPLREGSPQTVGETSTRVAVYTLYLSGLKQKYRLFLRHPDGTIVEVFDELEGPATATGVIQTQDQGSSAGKKDKGHNRLWKRKIFGRPGRVEPVGGSGCGSSFPKDLNQ